MAEVAVCRFRLLVSSSSLRFASKPLSPVLQDAAANRRTL